MPFVLLGLGLAAKHEEPPLRSDHIVQAAGRRALVSGLVVAGPEERPWGVYYTIETAAVRVDGRDRAVTGRLRLLISDRAEGAPRLAYGDRVRFLAWIRPIVDFANGQPNSYRRYLADRSIHARASIHAGGAVIKVLPPGGNPVVRWIETGRAAARELIRRAVGPEAAGLLRAVLLGDRAGLDPAVREAFQTTGAAHLLVVSGLHLAFLAALAFLLVRGLLTRSAWLCQRVNVILLSRAAALLPVTAYAALAGFSPPTWRAWVLVVAAVIGQGLGRVRDAWSGLIAAAFGLSVLWPPAPFSLSFQMSFTAVAALLWTLGRLENDLAGLWPSGGLAGAERLDERPGRFGRLAGRYFLGLAASSAVASLALAPLLARAFNQIPLGGIGLNVVLVPLITLAVVPLGLLGLGLGAVAPVLGGWALEAAGWLAEGGAWLATEGAAWPGMSLKVPSLNLFELALAYAFLVGLALALGASGARRRRRWGLVLAVLALAAGLADIGVWRFKLTGPETSLTVLDVGQGASLLLKLPGGERWLIDGGGFQHGSFDHGKMVVAPALLSRKITSLDTVVLTHPHPDHFKGLAYTLDHFSPDRFVYPGHPSDPGGGLEAILGRVRAGGLARPELAALHRGFKVGPVEIKALWPPPDFLDRPGRPAWYANPNETSLVLKVSHGRVSFLLTGDIERRAEAALVKRHDEGVIDLQSDVLYVPHHGGRSSATLEFLDRVRPKVAVISAGYENRYRVPAPEVLRRLAVVGAKVYRTDIHGAVEIETDGQKIEVETIRSASD